MYMIRLIFQKDLGYFHLSFRNEIMEIMLTFRYKNHFQLLVSYLPQLVKYKLVRNKDTLKTFFNKLIVTWNNKNCPLNEKIIKCQNSALKLNIHIWITEEKGEMKTKDILHVGFVKNKTS